MDRPDLLRRCLRAIADAPMKPSTVVIVDQSRDDDRTGAVVDLARPDLAPADVVYQRSHGGMARGQNEGVASISAPVVLVTDDDCVPAPNWVQTAADLFDREPSLGLLGGRVLPLGPPEPDRVPVASRTSSTAADLDHRSDPWALGSGNNFAIRREVMLAVRGNDERLGPGATFRGGADMDLFRRVLRSGVRGRYEPALVVHHERASVADRRRRRVPYGYGQGMACALWWRQRDARAGDILARHVAMRLRRLRRAVTALDRDAVIDEALVLWGTIRGVVRGVFVRDAGPRSGMAGP